MRKHSAQVTTPLIEAALRGTLTEAQARRLCTEGSDAVVLFSPAVTRHLADQEARLPGQQTQIAALHAQLHDTAPSPSTGPARTNR
jgi:hypothetical protein